MLKISSSLENYLESILMIQKDQKKTRIKDIASFLNVKAPSVIEAMEHLKSKKLIKQEPYGSIELTKEGEKTAKKVYEKHCILRRFLTQVLHVDPKTAEIDACNMEHIVSKRTLNAILKHIKSINK
ncbi:MAG: metal-dependent transcriptional regulator [Elusimicrobiota bacterium]